jgi:UrcA family protein
MNTYTFKSRHFKPLMALLALAPFAMIAPSQAAGTEIHTSNVTLADLDLSTSEGVNIARDRLHLAARRLCSQAVTLNSSNVENYIACMNETLTDAVRQIDQPGRAAVESGNWSTLPVNADKTDVRVISVAHIDLSTSEGARMAKQRVRKAAEHVCAQLASMDSGLDSNYAKCVNDATVVALRQIPTPAMAAMQVSPKPRIEVTTQVASK